MKRASVVSLLLLLTGPFFGCRGSAFATASKADSIDAYRQFLAKNPSDENADAARERLAELELAEARRVHTVVAYKRYLDEHPEGERARQASQLLEALRFNAAQQRNTALSWRQFIKDHPDGAHREEAEASLTRAELAELSKLDDVELARMASAHPDDPRGEHAAARLDDVAFEKATTAASLFGYLRDQPAGQHRDQAKVRLLSLELEGLLISGRVAEARALAARAPLSAQVPALAARLKRADDVEALGRSKDDAVLRALPRYYLRSLEDLVKSLHAPDPMDRWEAAEELGEHVDVKALDPLLEALRSARHPLVRQRAFDALARVLRALPGPVAEFEVASRVEAARAAASDGQVVLTLAALLDLSGQLPRAATEYQRAFDPNAPDPIVLRRWVAIRTARREPYSAAVAARQLSLWALEQVKETQAAIDASTLSTARALCAAVEYATQAREAIGAALAGSPEFADDVGAWSLRANDAVKLSEARLRDVELKLQESDARVRRCGDGAFRSRLAEAEQQRLEALQQLARKSPKSAPLVLELARERDPSPAIRTALATK
ncbi:MAG: HEAT repeat domain-containing protein [Archangiaceae bacterium]|nr:HEAT repeat domain-containing protein [Archangiaceae bacterium]